MMSTMACQNTVSRLFTQSFIQGADQRKHPSFVSLAFVRGIRWWVVNSLHKGPVTRKMFPFNDIIMAWTFLNLNPGPMNYVSFAPIYWLGFVSVCTHWQFCLHGQNCLKLFDRLYIRVCVCMCVYCAWLAVWVSWRAALCLLIMFCGWGAGKLDADTKEQYLSTWHDSLQPLAINGRIDGIDMRD